MSNETCVSWLWLIPFFFIVGPAEYADFPYADSTTLIEKDGTSKWYLIECTTEGIYYPADASGTFATDTYLNIIFRRIYTSLYFQYVPGTANGYEILLSGNIGITIPFQSVLFSTAVGFLYFEESFRFSFTSVLKLFFPYNFYTEAYYLGSLDEKGDFHTFSFSLHYQINRFSIGVGGKARLISSGFFIGPQATFSVWF
ncbi:MAG: hypothetical protein JW904_00980 [Spirochaetales bacterium]|nr:hypothetical protein [Spirochaetales bacterium]